MCEELHARALDPEVGMVYHNMGGSDYLCLKSYGDNIAMFRNVYSGWLLIAHWIVQYENGWIEWDYSEGLGFDAEYREQIRADIYRGDTE